MLSQALTIVHFDIDISESAIKLIERFSKSHGLQIPDAIIAATAITSKIELFTFNLKDFKYIDGLKFIKR